MNTYPMRSSSEGKSHKKDKKDRKLEKQRKKERKLEKQRKKLEERERRLAARHQMASDTSFSSSGSDSDSGDYDPGMMEPSRSSATGYDNEFVHADDIPVTEDMNGLGLEDTGLPGAAEVDATATAPPAFFDASAHAYKDADGYRMYQEELRQRGHSVERVTLLISYDVTGKTIAAKHRFVSKTLAPDSIGTDSPMNVAFVSCSNAEHAEVFENKQKGFQGHVIGTALHHVSNDTGVPVEIVLPGVAKSLSLDRQYPDNYVHFYIGKGHHERLIGSSRPLHGKQKEHLEQIGTSNVNAVLDSVKKSAGVYIIAGDREDHEPLRRLYNLVNLKTHGGFRPGLNSDVSPFTNDGYSFSKSAWREFREYVHKNFNTNDLPVELGTFRPIIVPRGHVTQEEIEVTGSTEYYANIPGLADWGISPRYLASLSSDLSVLTADQRLPERTFYAYLHLDYVVSENRS